MVLSLHWLSWPLPNPKPVLAFPVMKSSIFLQWGSVRFRSFPSIVCFLAAHFVLLVETLQGLLQAMMLSKSAGIGQGFLPVPHLQHVRQDSCLHHPSSELRLSLREAAYALYKTYMSKHCKHNYKLNTTLYFINLSASWSLHLFQPCPLIHFHHKPFW